MEVKTEFCASFYGDVKMPVGSKREYEKWIVVVKLATKVSSTCSSNFPRKLPHTALLSAVSLNLFLCSQSICNEFRVVNGFDLRFGKIKDN